MVFCTPAAVGAVAGGGATALGLKMDKQSVDLTRETFLQQMRQSKRLFTAQWAETSYRHGEALAQAAQQHAEAQALSTAQYYQAERIHSEDTKLARDQDNRAFEMAWRTEARESLRDELANQFNRYNIIMLCDTVCMGCIMPLVESGEPPQGTSEFILTVYLLTMGSSIMCFVVSLWFCVIVVRRLHEHTASILERKLFANTEQLQKVWQEQIENGLPTDYQVMNLVNQAYQDWLQHNINTMGNAAIQFLSVGVICMFITAGLLTHARYLIDFNAKVAVSFFWLTVIAASLTVIFFKLREDNKERIKEGSYDKSWLDIPTTVGPMAKIANAADQLFSATAVRLGSKRRRDQYKDREQSERSLVAQTEALHAKADSLLSEMGHRAKARKNVLEALTSATEEIDVLPEDLIARVNDLIHQVDELDKSTAQAIAMPSKYSDNNPNSVTDIDEEDEDEEKFTRKRQPMNDKPIDAHRTTVSLMSLRAKLGEIPLTTMIRIRNLSEESLRIKSGVQLTNGQYIKDIDVTLLTNHRHDVRASMRDREASGSKAIYHLFPIEEIPPRTEAVMVARSTGSRWIPTSSIAGELVFVNASQTWTFQIRFANTFNSIGVRQCTVDAVPLVRPDVQNKSSNKKWRIFRETVDHQNNHEVFVSIDQPQRLGGGGGGLANTTRPARLLPTKSGVAPKQAEPKSSNTIQNEEEEEDEARFLPSHHQDVPRMTGSLSLLVVGLQAHWLRRWCELASRSLTLLDRRGGTPYLEILLEHVTKVQAIPNPRNREHHVFDIYSTQRKPVRLGVASIAERDEWIRNISDAKGRDIADWGEHIPIALVLKEEKKVGEFTISRANGTSSNGSSSRSAGHISDLTTTPNNASIAEEARKNERQVFMIEHLPV